MSLVVAAFVLFPTAGLDVQLQRVGGANVLSLRGKVFRTTTSPIERIRCLSLKSGGMVALWSEGTDDFSALSCDGGPFARVAPVSRDLKLRQGSFDPVRSMPAIAPVLRAPTECGTVIVQFVSQPFQDYRDAIVGLGGIIENYLPDNAYVVEIASDKLDEVRALPYVRWVGPLHPQWRLDEQIVRGLELGTLRKDTYNLQVAGDSPSTKLRVAAEVMLAGGRILSSPPKGTLMTVELSPAALVNAARIDGVLFIDPEGRPEPDMDNVRAMSGATGVATVAGYRGQGVRAHVIDAGFRATHVDTAGRVIVRGNSAETNHGTATTGILWGNGSGNSTGTGVMPLAQGVFSVYVQDWIGADRLAFTEDTVNTYNCVVESNSWGDTLTGAYTTVSSYMDEIVYKTDLCILNSMSNWGNNVLVRPQAWAKNVVSIGGVNHFDDSDKSNDAWQSTGSIGPAADGRVKPDLCFYFDAIFCPSDRTDTAYTSAFGGTSAATPAAAGCFGLTFQMFADGLFGNTCLGSSVFENRCHASTAKALVVNQAYTYPNSQNDIERMRQGWGLPNVRNVFDTRDEMFIVDETDVLENLQSKSYPLYVSPGTPALKASMAYTDYWAAPNAQPTRVNTLTLKVTDPNGAVYYGNNGMVALFDASNTTSPGGGPDAKNNLQNVWVKNPAAGKWTVTVSADSVVADGRPETPGVTDADFGLVVSGVKYSVIPATVAAYRPLCVTSGGTTEIYKSDNTNVLLRTPLQAAQQQFIQSGVVVTGTSPAANPASLRLVAEGQTNLTSNRFKVRYWNYQAGDWEDVSDTAATTNTDSAVTVSPSGNLSRFVDQTTNQIQAAVFFERDTTLPAVQSWASKLDHVRWFVNP